jgi:membrane fusion protein, multidrug efflux system
MTAQDRPPSFARIPTKALIAAGAIVGLILLLLYLQGTIGGHKVAPGIVPLPAGGEIARASAVAVEQRDVEDLIEWPGTVTSQTVANVAPKVMAHVLEVRVRAGATVKAGEVIATLDDREVRARVAQARAALGAAQAQATQAEADQRRLRSLFEKQAATAQDLDAVDARAKATRAQVAQARDAVAEAEVLLGETTVRAPFDGIVAQRLVDPGDMAVPGRPVVVIHDPTSLRLEAHVAERCIGALRTGMEVPARFDTPPRQLTAHIEEIAPMADPQSRTFLVKAALPSEPDILPGLFGTLRSSCGRHAALLVPAGAVSRKGQLERVQVVVDGVPLLRDVRTGKMYGNRIEVLSGLSEGEMVVIAPGS